MNRPDINDEDWRDIFSHLRMLVIRSGYATWDSSMIDALSEEESQREEESIETSNLYRLQEYTRSLYDYIKIRSTPAILEQRKQINEILFTKEEGLSIDNAVVNIDGEEIPFLYPDKNIDSILSSIKSFSLMIHGDDNNFFRGYSEPSVDPEDPEDPEDLRDNEP